MFLFSSAQRRTTVWNRVAQIDYLENLKLLGFYFFKSKVLNSFELLLFYSIHNNSNKQTNTFFKNLCFYQPWFGINYHCYLANSAIYMNQYQSKAHF